MEETKKISSKKFAAMLERIINNGHPLEIWYPSMEDVKKIMAEPAKHYEFLIWILESNPNRKLTEEQKKVELLLQDFLKRYTEITG